MAERHHILSVLVENKAGVLARVAGLFSRRGFNIFSLAVAPTDDERFSRITIVVDVESVPLQQILDQLDKLINVVEIHEIAPANALESELLLATVQAGPAEREALVEAALKVGADVVDESEEHTTVSLAGHPDLLDEFEGTLGAFGITELQRTGRIALPKLA